MKEIKGYSCHGSPNCSKTFFTFDLTVSSLVLLQLVISERLLKVPIDVRTFGTVLLITLKVPFFFLIWLCLTRISSRVKKWTSDKKSLSYFDTESQRSTRSLKRSTKFHRRIHWNLRNRRTRSRRLKEKEPKSYFTNWQNYRKDQ